MTTRNPFIRPVFRREAEHFLADFSAWFDERRSLADQEESGDFPHPDDWADSDEVAVDLLHEAADLVRRLLYQGAIPEEL